MSPKENRLKLRAALADGPRTVKELAAEMGVGEYAVRRLLVHGWFERRPDPAGPDRWSLTESGRAAGAG